MNKRDTRVKLTLCQRRSFAIPQHDRLQELFITNYAYLLKGVLSALPTYESIMNRTGAPLVHMWCTECVL